MASKKRKTGLIQAEILRLAHKESLSEKDKEKLQTLATEKHKRKLHHLSKAVSKAVKGACSDNRQQLKKRLTRVTKQLAKSGLKSGLKGKLENDKTKVEARLQLATTLDHDHVVQLVLKEAKPTPEEVAALDRVFNNVQLKTVIQQFKNARKQGPQTPVVSRKPIESRASDKDGSGKNGDTVGSEAGSEAEPEAEEGEGSIAARLAALRQQAAELASDSDSESGFAMRGDGSSHHKQTLTRSARDDKERRRDGKKQPAVAPFAASDEEAEEGEGDSRLQMVAYSSDEGDFDNDDGVGDDGEQSARMSASLAAFQSAVAGDSDDEQGERDEMERDLAMWFGPGGAAEGGPKGGHKSDSGATSKNKKTKRNRPGQRERQKRAAKLYGKDAKHVQDPSRDANLRQQKMRESAQIAKRKAKQREAQQDGSDDGKGTKMPKKGMSGQKDTGSASNTQGTGGGGESLHPSWQAKKSQQNQLTAKFAGSSITFSDSD
eukprot:m.160911 g.160911  ORF g.160911 m.160911 type:complete len:490 (-) comp14356_c0_seq1:47-1516(-)